MNLQRNCIINSSIPSSKTDTNADSNTGDEWNVVWRRHHSNSGTNGSVARLVSAKEEEKYISFSTAIVPVFRALSRTLEEKLGCRSIALKIKLINIGRFVYEAKTSVSYPISTERGDLSRNKWNASRNGKRGSPTVQTER